MTGLKSFQKRMRAIPAEVRKSVEPALAQGAYEAAEMMEQLAPERTGDLVGSIQVTLAGQATPAYSQPGGATVVPSNAALVTVGNTDVRYAHLVEYGTSKTPAQPFFWPAWRLVRKRAENRIKRAIAKAVKEAR